MGATCTVDIHHPNLALCGARQGQGQGEDEDEDEAKAVRQASTTCRSRGTVDTCLIENASNAGRLGYRITPDIPASKGAPSKQWPDGVQSVPGFMNRTAIFCSFLTLCVAVPAQVTSPSGYDTLEATLSCRAFGGYSNGRQMYLDGEVRGTAMVIKDLSFRVDYRDHTAVTGYGRSWSRVTLDIANADISTASLTFSQNQLTTPTRVFQGKVTWPPLAGLPLADPPPWGGPNGELRFGFRSPWRYDGRTDLSLDFDFAGGTLGNNYAWHPLYFRQYYLDSYPYKSTSFAVNMGRPVLYGKGDVNGGCVDAASTLPRGGYVVMYSDTREYFGTNPAQQFFFYTRTHWTAPSQPVVHAVALAGVPLGVTLPGVTCNKLYLDMSVPRVIYHGTADTRGDFLNRIGSMPYIGSWVGLELWAQGAWLDSSTLELLLTRAAMNRVMRLVYAAPKRRYLYQWIRARRAAKGLV